MTVMSTDDLIDFTPEDIATRKRLARMSSVLTHAAEDTGEPGIVGLLGGLMFCSFMGQALGMDADKLCELMREARILADDIEEYGHETIAQTELRLRAERQLKN